MRADRTERVNATPFFLDDHPGIVLDAFHDEGGLFFGNVESQWHFGQLVVALVFGSLVQAFDWCVQRTRKPTEHLQSILRIADDSTVDCRNEHSFVVGNHSPVHVEDSSALGDQLHDSRLHVSDDLLGLVSGDRLKKPDAREQQDEETHREHPEPRPAALLRVSRHDRFSPAESNESPERVALQSRDCPRT